MKSQILSAEYEQIIKLSEACFCRINGFLETDKRKKEAFLLRDRYIDQLLPKIVIKEGAENKVYYAMCVSPLVYQEETDLLDEFYLDSWMTAMLDAGRVWLLSYLTERESKKGSGYYVTGPTGPGFDGIGLETLEEYLERSDGQKIGIGIRNGMLFPVKSNVGYFYLSEEEQGMTADCSNCLSDQKNCTFCMYYNQK